MNTILKTRTGTVSEAEALRMLDGKSNYDRIARGYIRYLVNTDMDASHISKTIYVRWIQKNRGLSNGTRYVYQTAINNFLDICEEYNVLKIKPDVQVQHREKMTHSLDNYVQLFLAEADIRDSSKQTYKRALTAFIRFVEDNGLPMSKKSVLDWRESLRGNLSPFTVNIYLSAVRQFAKYIVENPDKIFSDQDDPSPILKELTRIGTVKKLDTSTDELLKDTFSHDEMKTLLTINDQRTRLMIGLMYYAGLRTIEVERLRLEDWRGDFMLIHGKGRDVKQRVQVNDALKTMLADYIGDRIAGQLIVGINTGQIRKAVNKVLGDLHLKEGEAKRSCHSFRHSFCVHLLEAGVPVQEVQVLARHKSITTTEGYLKKMKRKTMRKAGITNVLSI